MSLREKFLLIVVSIALIFSVYAWYRERPTPPTPPQPQHGNLDPIPGSKPTGTVSCPSSGIVIISGPATSVSYDSTPKWINDIINKDIEYPIANGVVKPWGGETYVWTYMNIQTGNSRMIFEQQPFTPKPDPKKKFFEYLNEKEIGLLYGYGTNGRAIQIYGEWEFFRTGAFNWKTKIESYIYDNKSDVFLFVGGSYKWK